ncbi:MAG TPA: hypothetical protein VHA74_03915 [Candidatus Dojkabacteria bacterium]|nr:hypothetical protein [Candidatus Dojkabacteria bacterium]
MIKKTVLILMFLFLGVWGALIIPSGIELKGTFRGSPVYVMYYPHDVVCLQTLLGQEQSCIKIPSDGEKEVDLKIDDKIVYAIKVDPKGEYKVSFSIITPK